MNISYVRKYYHHYHRTRKFWLNNPEDKWFNYLGEYTKRYKSGGSEENWRGWHDDDWKEKYQRKRARLKEKTRKEINDEIGERYYISY